MAILDPRLNRMTLFSSSIDFNFDTIEILKEDPNVKQVNVFGKDLKRAGKNEGSETDNTSEEDQQQY